MVWKMVLCWFGLSGLFAWAELISCFNAEYRWASTPEGSCGGCSLTRLWMRCQVDVRVLVSLFGLGCRRIHPGGLGSNRSSRVTVTGRSRAARFSHVVRYGCTPALGSAVVPSILDGASRRGHHWPPSRGQSLASAWRNLRRPVTLFSSSMDLKW